MGHLIGLAFATSTGDSGVRDRDIVPVAHPHVGQLLPQSLHPVPGHSQSNVRHYQIIVRVHRRTTFDQVQVHIAHCQPRAMSKNNFFKLCNASETKEMPKNARSFQQRHNRGLPKELNSLYVGPFHCKKNVLNKYSMF